VLRHPWSGNFRELENFAQRLPTAARAGAIDASTVREALSEGAATPRAPASSAPPAQTSASWDRVLRDACATWSSDHAGVAPESFGHLKDFVDNHLKPAFVAHACEVADGDVPVAGVNYSAVGRKLDIGDGTTVKRWLDRYFSRRRG
jgi:transcriptional regulator of acetoin/glycerol metabolism